MKDEAYRTLQAEIQRILSEAVKPINIETVQTQIEKTYSYTQNLLQKLFDLQCRKDEAEVNFRRYRFDLISTSNEIHEGEMLEGYLILDEKYSKLKNRVQKIKHLIDQVDRSLKTIEDQRYFHNKFIDIHKYVTEVS